MKIRFHKKFEKQFSKLKKSNKRLVLKTLETFQENPNAPELRNHALKGRLENQRSISAGFDLRLIYIETANSVEIIFLRVGAHSEVY